jgi:hypothetical protein
MENLQSIVANENKPKELIKPLKVEEALQGEKVLEALCESRNICFPSSNNSVGNNDDILF